MRGNKRRKMRDPSDSLERYRYQQSCLQTNAQPTAVGLEVAQSRLRKLEQQTGQRTRRGLPVCIGRRLAAS